MVVPPGSNLPLCTHHRFLITELPTSQSQAQYWVIHEVWLLLLLLERYLSLYQGPRLHGPELCRVARACLCGLGVNRALWVTYAARELRGQMMSFKAAAFPEETTAEAQHSLLFSLPSLLAAAESSMEVPSKCQVRLLPCQVQPHSLETSQAGKCYPQAGCSSMPLSSLQTPS